MDIICLKSDNYIPSGIGGNVTFHKLKRDKNNKPFSLYAGGNITFHSLAGETTTLHTHEFGEICLILSGKIRHHINSEIVDLKGGSLIFIRPFDIHCFETFESETCELVNFVFQLETLLELGNFLGDTYFLHRFTAPVISPTFTISSEETEKLSIELLKINNSSKYNLLENARVRIKKVLTELFITYFLDPVSNFEEHNIPNWLTKLCDEMRKPENFSIGLKKMLVLANCTQQHLCKSFKRYFNKTPTAFINELRVHYAARMLSDTNEEIFAIASDLGFQSLSRFYTLFKEHYGIPPAKYRELSRRSDIPV